LIIVFFNEKAFLFSIHIFSAKKRIVVFSFSQKWTLTLWSLVSAAVFLCLKWAAVSLAQVQNMVSIIL